MFSDEELLAIKALVNDLTHCCGYSGDLVTTMEYIGASRLLLNEDAVSKLAGKLALTEEEKETLRQSDIEV